MDTKKHKLFFYIYWWRLMLISGLYFKSEKTKPIEISNAIEMPSGERQFGNISL